MDFTLNSENIYLIPSYLSKDEDLYLKTWKSLDLLDHVFIFSSGTTTHKKKSYALSKTSLLKNAKAVNDFLNITSSDKWLNVLPEFHVGGLSIYVRAYLSSSEVINLTEKWDPYKFCKTLANNISYCSLVPTQVYSLLEQNLKAPNYLKGVFIGGDFIAPDLVKKFYNNGWPVILTYGMTETCSQIASSFYHENFDGFLEVLPIHQILNDQIISQSLLTAEISFSDSIEINKLNSKQIKLLDSLEVRDFNSKQYIKPLGRNDGAIKIKGRLYYLNDIKAEFQNIFYKLKLLGKAEIFFDTTTNDMRIIVLLENSMQYLSDDIIKLISMRIKPLESLIDFKYLDKLEKTSLGKVKKIF